MEPVLQSLFRAELGVFSSYIKMDTDSSSISLYLEKEFRPIAAMSLRQSDFSIDHILNRAGERSSPPKQLPVEFHHDSFAIENPTKHFDERMMFANHLIDLSDSPKVPIFNWLQYTRYRPPKLHSKYIKQKFLTEFP